MKGTFIFSFRLVSSLKHRKLAESTIINDDLMKGQREPQTWQQKLLLLNLKGEKAKGT